jgi:hypothetical protein
MKNFYVYTIKTKRYKKKKSRMNRSRKKYGKIKKHLEGWNEPIRFKRVAKLAPRRRTVAATKTCAEGKTKVRSYTVQGHCRNKRKKKLSAMDAKLVKEHNSLMDAYNIPRKKTTPKGRGKQFVKF